MAFHGSRTPFAHCKNRIMLPRRASGALPLHETTIARRGQWFKVGIRERGDCQLRWRLDKSAAGASAPFEAALTSTAGEKRNEACLPAAHGRETTR